MLYSISKYSSKNKHSTLKQGLFFAMIMLRFKKQFIIKTLAILIIVSLSTQIPVEAVDNLRVQIGNPDSYVRVRKIQDESIRRALIKHPLVITIDGGSGTGKSTIAGNLAERLGVIVFSYGSLYRLASFIVSQKNISIRKDMSDGEIKVIADILQEEIDINKFSFSGDQEGHRYFYDGKDITKDLARSDIVNTGSFISQYPRLRAVIVGYAGSIIKKIKENSRSYILEGRVAGTELAPYADIKVYLETDLEVRVGRRAKEYLKDDKDPEFGKVSDAVKKDILERDNIDKNRQYMPLKPAEDALLIETTALSVEQVTNVILNRAAEILKIGEPEKRAGPDDSAKVAINLVGFKSPAQPYITSTLALHALSGNLKSYFGDSVAVKTYDMYADYTLSIDSVVDEIVKSKPKLLGLSIVPGTLNYAKELFEKVNKLMPEKERPLFVLGNASSTYASEVLLREYFPGAVAVYGEGEIPLIELTEYVMGIREMDSVHNLVYIKEGQSVRTKPVEGNIEEFASPDMKEIVKLAKKGASIFIEASRGCPWGNCLFCAVRDLLGSRKSSRRWRGKKVEEVLKEIEFLADNNVTSFNFADEEFIGQGLSGVKRAQEIARGIIDIRRKTGKEVSFTFACRVDAVYNEEDNEYLREERVETFRLLKEAGVSNVFLGIESGSQSQLNRLNKGINIAESENAVATLRKLGLGFEAGFIMFDPETTLKEVEENISFIEKNDLLTNTSWFLNALRLQVGTPFVKKYKNRPEINMSLQPDYNTLRYSYTFAHKEIERLERVTHNAFGNIHRLYYFLKFIRRSGIEEKEFDIYGRYRHMLLRLDLEFFKKFLNIEKSEELLDNEKNLSFNKIINELRLIQLDIGEGLIRELKNAGMTAELTARKTIDLAEDFIKVAENEITDAILSAGYEKMTEVAHPRRRNSEEKVGNDIIFVLKPGGTFNKVIILDLLERIRSRGYGIGGIRVYAGEGIKAGNKFEKAYPYLFRVAREGEALFSETEYAKVRDIYDTPAFSKYFGTDFRSTKIIPVFDLISKYRLEEREAVDLWMQGYKEELFMKGDCRGMNKIGTNKYVLVATHPRVENGKPFLLVNGIALQMKMLSEIEGARTVVFILRSSGDGADTWKDMREEFIGDKSPLESPPGSIRYDAFSGKMNITEDVPFWKNAVHLSSGFLESLGEEALWFEIPVEKTNSGRMLLDLGYTAEEIRYLVTDPEINIRGVIKPINDWIKNMDCQEALSFINRVFPPFYDKEAMPTMTFSDYLKYQALHDKGLLSMSTNRVRSEDIKESSAQVTACPYIGTPENASFSQTGNSLIRDGKVAQVLIAGGTSGRWFGYDIPEDKRIRFIAEAYEFLGKVRSFAELRIANNLWVSREAGGEIPMWIMDSQLSDKTIKTFLMKNNYFGIPSERMHFYTQGSVPRINPTMEDLEAAFPDESGEWIRERIKENGGEGGIFRFSDGSINAKTTGHFDAIANLFLSRELLKMLDQGIEYIHFSDATNLGTNVDPVILGMLAKSDKDMLHILVKKNKIYEIDIGTLKGRFLVVVREGKIIYSSLPGNLLPVIEQGELIGIKHADTGDEIKAEIYGKLEKGGTLVDLHGKPQILEGFRFPEGYDQGKIPYFSTVTQIIKAESLLRIYGMDIEEYRNASTEQLLEKISDVGSKLNTYLEIKRVLDDNFNETRIAAQLSRLSGDLTSILPTEFVLIDRDGQKTQSGFVPFKLRDDLEINKGFVHNILSNRVIFIDTGSPLREITVNEKQAIGSAL